MEGEAQSRPAARKKSIATRQSRNPVQKQPFSRPIEIQPHTGGENRKKDGENMSWNLEVEKRGSLGSEAQGGKKAITHY